MNKADRVADTILRSLINAYYYFILGASGIGVVCYFLKLEKVVEIMVYAIIIGIAYRAFFRHNLLFLIEYAFLGSISYLILNRFNLESYDLLVFVTFLAGIMHVIIMKILMFIIRKIG